MKNKLTIKVCPYYNLENLWYIKDNHTHKCKRKHIKILTEVCSVTTRLKNHPNVINTISKSHIQKELPPGY